MSLNGAIWLSLPLEYISVAGIALTLRSTNNTPFYALNEELSGYRKFTHVDNITLKFKKLPKPMFIQAN